MFANLSNAHNTMLVAYSYRGYRPILLLIVLPASLTFLYFKGQIDTEPLTFRIESKSRKWQPSAGIYLLHHKQQQSGRIFAKPLDPFYAVEAPSQFFISESSTAPACLYHASNAVPPVCSENQTTLQGEYFDSNGNILVSITRVQQHQSAAYGSNKNWILLTQQIPATSLLIALNVALAYLYWDRRVDPSVVAKVYDSMVNQPFEIWRSFTGSTAHFSVWHLGLNMMSFTALGREVEPRFSSLVFLYYNISLMPIVTMIWLSLHWVGMRYFHGANQCPTVGYSGVLFAWMVVAALEQPQTCPVIFFPNLCFQTYQLGVFRFSLGPVVQLFVMQLILPRVSFYGHLSGIVAGFFMHWGLLPIRLVQPWILVPLLYSLYLRFVRQINFKPLWSIGCGLGSTKLLCLVYQVAIVSISAYLSQWDEVVAQGITGSFWLLSQIPENEFNERHTLIKATVVAAVLGITNNAAKLGFFLAFQTLNGTVSLTLFMRSTALFWMILSCGINDLNEDEGIFQRILALPLLSFIRAVGPSPSRSILPAFDEGQRLGGRSASRNGERPLSRLV